MDARMLTSRENRRGRIKWLNLSLATRMSFMLRPLSSIPTILFAYYVIGRRLRARRAETRRQAIPHEQERVLIVGSSSGVGREIALQYAQRGARVALVGRKADDLKRVLQECIAVSPRPASLEDQNTLREQNSGNSSACWGLSGPDSAKFEIKFIYVAADCSTPEDSAKIRATVEDSRSMDLNPRIVTFLIPLYCVFKNGMA